MEKAIEVFFGEIAGLLVARGIMAIADRVFGDQKMKPGQGPAPA
jgi:hypothetical protein